MCGFVGLIGVQAAAPALVIGLQAIQHRGQDAAGLGTWDAGQFSLEKEMGLVTTALPPDVVGSMQGHAGIAHVRYPTAGPQATRNDAQPFITRRPGILLAHNGNVTNVPELSQTLRNEGWHVLSQCDAEPILLVMAEALTRLRPAGHSQQDVAHAVREVHRRVRGAYTVVALMQVDGEDTLISFRDPHGIRPGVYGSREDGAWIAASESVSLDVLGFQMIDDIPVGEVVFMRPGHAAVCFPVDSKLADPTARARPCVFERIYFARPDSIMEKSRVNRVRWRLGRQLAREWRERGIEADLVIAVPDTSRPAAQAMAEELGVPHREGFIKNRYSGRTFIMPDQATRNAALRLKLNPIREMFEGKRVLLVDDSIVRGNTMRRIVQMVWDLNPVAVHLGIYSPPVRNPCFYGIDMPSAEELIAARWPGEQVETELCRHLGVDSVTYLSLSGLEQVEGEKICAACFDGDYCVPVSDAERSSILTDRRPD
jgi:amidophosphoribosyltransferase